MSDKNIDKDIEILKEHIKELDEEKVLYGGFLSRKQAIENVLAELEDKELKIKVNTSNLALLNDNNNKLKAELETYKKIAEKLAEISRCVNVSDSECRKKTCEQCVLEWARKEVEND